MFRCNWQDIVLLGKLACPVQLFMAILTLQSVGKFVGVRFVTQLTLYLMYLSWGAALLLTLEQASEMEDAIVVNFLAIFFQLNTFFSHLSSCNAR